MKYKLYLGLTIFALLVTIIPVYAQEQDESELCVGENPQYGGVEQIDEYVYLFTNELGQQFTLTFSSESNAEAVQLFVEELQICLAFTTESPLLEEIIIPSASIVAGEETTEVFALFEKDGEVTISSSIPYTSILIETLADILGLSIEELDELLSNYVDDNEITLFVFLEEVGIDPTSLLEEASNRVLIDQELVTQYLEEAGYLELDPLKVLDDAIQQYSIALEQPGMPIFLGEVYDEYELLISVDFAMDDDMASEFNTIYFAIDPSLNYGWWSRHAYCLGQRGWMQANITAKDGYVSGTMFQLPTANSNLKIIWGGAVTPPNSTFSDQRWADSLHIAGWNNSNKYTLSGTWIRSATAAEDQPDSCMNLQ